MMSSLEKRLTEELLTHGLEHVLAALLRAIRNRLHWECDPERAKHWTAFERHVTRLLRWMGEGYRWAQLGACHHYKRLPWWKRW